MALALDGGIHFTEMKTRTRKEGLKQEIKKSMKWIARHLGMPVKIRAMKQFLLAFA
ncbi:hypothetical protein ACVXG9_28450 [Escherichia coli]